MSYVYVNRDEQLTGANAHEKDGSGRQYTS
jgi:hypothetical protein